MTGSNRPEMGALVVLFRALFQEEGLGEKTEFSKAGGG